MSNREFIHRTVYKSHIILMIISVLVGIIALNKCPSSVRHVQTDVRKGRLVVNRINEPQQNQLGNPQEDKVKKKNIRHNVKPERKIKEFRKNNSGPLGDFIGLCLIGVSMLAIAALFVLLYGLGETSAGVLVVGVALAGILFILIFIKLIKLGKKLGKKPKDSASGTSKNAVKKEEEKAFVMISR